MLIFLTPESVRAYIVSFELHGHCVICRKDTVHTFAGKGTNSEVWNASLNCINLTLYLCKRRLGLGVCLSNVWSVVH